MDGRIKLPRRSVLKAAAMAALSLGSGAIVGCGEGSDERWSAGGAGLGARTRAPRSARLGINVARTGWIPASFVRDMGVGVVRLVAHHDAHDVSYIDELRSYGIRTWLVVARESFDGFGPTDHEGFPTRDTRRRALDEYRRRYGGHVDVWQAGNEADLVSPSSWTLRQDQLSDLLWSARDALPNAYIVAGGLAAGHAGWLDGVNLDWVDGIAVHPYGRWGDGGPPAPGWGFGHVADLLEGYLRWLHAAGFGHKHLHVSEWGAWTPELSEEQQARYVRDMALTFRDGSCRDLAGDSIQFCLHDAMVEGFGLLRTDWSPKPAFQQYVNTCHGF